MLLCPRGAESNFPDESTARAAPQTKLSTIRGAGLGFGRAHHTMHQDEAWTCPDAGT